MKHKTAELEGALLRRAVAMALGWSTDPTGMPYSFTKHGFAPDIKWELGGPILERERIAIFPGHGDVQPLHLCWTAMLTNDDTGDYRADTEHVGPTPLIAAMRAYVEAKFGGEVELP